MGGADSGYAAHAPDLHRAKRDRPALRRHRATRVALSLFALVLVLTSAVFHATWNLLAKRAGAGTPFLWLSYVIRAIVFAPFPVALPVLARPDLGLVPLI